MASFFFGLLLSANRARPVVPVAHSFSHCFFDWFFKMFLAVAIVHGFSFCGFRVPSLANSSARSFPLISLCPGIH